VTRPQDAKGLETLKQDINQAAVPEFSRFSLSDMRPDLYRPFAVYPPPLPIRLKSDNFCQDRCKLQNINYLYASTMC